MKNSSYSEKNGFFAEKPWFRQAIISTVWMYVLMVILFPLAIGDEITLSKVLWGILIWAIAGLGYGVILWQFNHKKRK